MRDDLKHKFSEKERLDRLRLIRSQNVGPVTYHQLLGRFKSGSAALEALPDLARRGGRKGIRICSRPAAEREMNAHARAGAELIFHGERSYPPRLAVINDAPPVLSAMGDPGLLVKKSIAIVGARNASSNGKRLATELSADLGRNGYLVVSGLARGIDAAAHAGALPTGTVAVLGCGVDIVYPKENTQLYEDIKGKGALIAEVAPGTRPTARQFPRRNRIISGMSRGVVVVEASPRSGSLITARLAADQGREVFAVPGAAYDPRGRGTNSLIRDGAVLTESADDVLSVMEAMPRVHFETVQNAEPAFGEETTDRIHSAIVRALGAVPTAVDDLVRQVDLPTETVATALLELELAGKLERHPGNQVGLLAGT